MNIITAKKIGLIVYAILFIPVLVSLIFPGVWSFLYIKARFSRSLRPDLYQLPIEKQLAPFSDPNGEYKQIFYQNLAFSSPFHDVKDTQEKDSMTRISTVSGKVLVLGQGKNTLADSLPQTKVGREIEKLKEFDRKEPSLEFSFDQAILNSTPEHITLATLRNDLQTQLDVMEMKSALMARMAGNDVFFFRTPSVKGFEFIGRNPNDATSLVELFTLQGKHYTLVARKLTQEEIDFILSSIQTNVLK